MRGEIDFAESLRRRVALLAGLPVAALERVYDERLRLSPGAERMLAGFAAIGAKTALLSGGFTFFTDRLKARLKLDYTTSNTLEIVDGKLTGRIGGAIVDAGVKAATLRTPQGRTGRQVEDWWWPSATAPTTCRCLPRPTFPSPIAPSPSCARRRRYAIDHCGLDGVLNLFSLAQEGRDIHDGERDDHADRADGAGHALPRRARRARQSRAHAGPLPRRARCRSHAAASGVA